MIKVRLQEEEIIHPLIKAIQVAGTCYQAEMPQLKTEVTEKLIDFVRNNLWKVGHHTTFQHSYFTFEIEGIAVSDVTFGLHLDSPFYNSDQRSGRFCSEMFLNPDFNEIKEYLRFFYGQKIASQDFAGIIDFIKKGVEIYKTHLAKAEELAEFHLKNERPKLSEKAVKTNAKKIAQEQMRVFISTIFPTALVHTINLSALATLWESAWNPVMRFLTEAMATEVLKKFPELDFLFDPNRRRQSDWGCEDDMTTISSYYPRSIVKPYIEGAKLYCFGQKIIDPAQLCQICGSDLMHPVDKLRFTPELMDNNAFTLSIEKAHMSIATMGQDQRHRTINRSEPHFSGEFYAPPLVKEIVNYKLARDYFSTWYEFSLDLSPAVATAIAPYGTVVVYDKSGPINAFLHESAKRLCWCAQEEIYHLNLSLINELEKNFSRAGLPNEDEAGLIELLKPPCQQTGQCGEGARYCGRDLSVGGSPERKI